MDLWTAEEGRSDLTLELTLTDSRGEIYQIEIDDIHVTFEHTRAPPENRLRQVRITRCGDAAGYEGRHRPQRER